jgi:MGT family glycosyltransferase
VSWWGQRSRGLAAQSIRERIWAVLTLPMRSADDDLVPHKFLIATMPVPGHVAPFAPLVRELLKRGHEVLWYGSRHFQRGIEATGARFAPMVQALDIGDADYDRHFPGRDRLSGLKKVVFDFEKIFVDAVPGMMADLSALLAEFPADVLLGDPAVAATRLLSEQGGPPAAILNITVLTYETPELAAFGLGLPFNNGFLGRVRNWLSYRLVDHVVFKPVNRAYARLALKHGWAVQPIRPSLSDYLHLQPMVEQFEYPITQLPRQVHFVGVLLPDPPDSFDPPAWWGRVLQSGKPIVLVTQGTIATHAEELIRPTLEGLAGEDVWVIATTGGKRAEELGFSIPANAIVEPFVPFVTLMPHVQVYVTNGGYGGICIALAHGVPVISAGTTEDKMEVSNRVAHSGVGLNLKTNRPSKAQVQGGVRQLLSEPSFRSKASAIQAALSRHDAAREAAALLEELAVTRRPVLREQP